MARNLILKTVISAGAAVLLCGSASASALTGAVYENDTSNDASTDFSGVTPSATFTPTVIDYSSGALYTIGEFLGADAASLSAPIGGDTLLNTHFTITGTLGLKSGNNSFVVGHDDGVVLTLGGGFGTVVDAPGPTAFNNSPFNVFNSGPAENVSFTLNYNECCGAPGDLLFTVNNVSPGVPEPATWALMLTGFGVAGAALRHRSNNGRRVNPSFRRCRGEWRRGRENLPGRRIGS